MRTIIENIITGMTDPGDPAFFEWGVLPEFNLTQDENTLYPAVCMLPVIVQGELPQQSIKSVINVYTVTLLFVNKTELDDTWNLPKYNVVKEMERIAIKFLGLLIKDIRDLRNNSKVLTWMLHSLNPEDKLDFEQFFNFFDTNVDGKGITINIEMREPLENCLI